MVAPTKVLIVPLSAREEFDPLIREVCKSIHLSRRRARFKRIHTVASKFRKAGVFARVDDSNTTIGKRYARNDELGTPFGVTLDFACDYYFYFYYLYDSDTPIALRQRYKTRPRRFGEWLGLLSDDSSGGFERKMGTDHSNFPGNETR